MAVNGCCMEWEQEITLYLDGEMPPQSRSRVERHLQHCDCCSRFFHQLEREEHLLAGRLRHQAIEFLPPPDFCDRVMGALPAYQPNPVVQLLKLRWQQVQDFFFVEGHRHIALAASMLICVAGILLSLKAGNVTELEYIHVKHNGALTRTLLPDLFFISQIDGDFYEFPDRSLVYATYGTYFTVEDYPQDQPTTDVGTERRLSLRSGELYVDVHPEKEVFTIYTPNAQITVFGTQFYICVRSNPEKETIVAVRKGTVMVEKRGRNGSTVLNAGQQSSVLFQQGEIKLRPPEPMDLDLQKKLDEFNTVRSDRSILRGLYNQSNPFEHPGTYDLNAFDLPELSPADH